MAGPFLPERMVHLGMLQHLLAFALLGVVTADPVINAWNKLATDKITTADPPISSQVYIYVGWGRAKRAGPHGCGGVRVRVMLMRRRRRRRRRRITLLLLLMMMMMVMIPMTVVKG
jgi:hypothetical protein